MNDWLPGSRTEQLRMARNWLMVITPEKAAAWGIPPAVMNGLDKAAEDAGEALRKAMDAATRTMVITAECKTAFGALERTLRDIKNRYFFVPPLTEADLVSLGLKPRASSSPIPAPETQPEADLTFPGIHLVDLKNIRAAAGGEAPDPRSDYGVRIHYGLSGEPTEAHRFRVAGVPKTGRDLPESLFTRRQKERFDFDGESGNRVYFCLQYETPSGGESGKGPFGPIFSAVIP
jgi:hypothetical protein